MKKQPDLKFSVEDVDAPPPQVRRSKYGDVVEKLLAQTKNRWRAFRFKDEQVVRKLGVAAKRRVPKNVQLRIVGSVIYMRNKTAKRQKRI